MFIKITGISLSLNRADQKNVTCNPFEVKVGSGCIATCFLNSPKARSDRAFRQKANGTIQVVPLAKMLEARFYKKNLK
jgi:hypothetical protein